MIDCVVDFLKKLTLGVRAECASDTRGLHASRPVTRALRHMSYLAVFSQVALKSPSYLDVRLRRRRRLDDEDLALLVVALEELAVARQQVRLGAEVVGLPVLAQLARQVLPQVVLPADAVRPGEVVDVLARPELREPLLLQVVAPVDVERVALDEAAEAGALERPRDAVDALVRTSCP